MLLSIGIINLEIESLIVYNRYNVNTLYSNLVQQPSGEINNTLLKPRRFKQEEDTTESL